MTRQIYFLEKVGLCKRPELFNLPKLLHEGKEPENKAVAIFLQKFRWIPKWKLNNAKIVQKEFERILEETLEETQPDIFKNRRKLEAIKEEK